MSNIVEKPPAGGGGVRRGSWIAWVLYVALAIGVGGLVTVFVMNNTIGKLLADYTDTSYTTSYAETDSARISHYYITMPIVNCFYTDRAKLTKALEAEPDLLNRTFLLSWLPDLPLLPAMTAPIQAPPPGTVDSRPPDAAAPTDPSTYLVGWQTLDLRPVERRVLYLSSLLARSRVDAAAQLAAASRSNTQMKTWVILLGTFTTILVGWKAIATSNTIFSLFIGGLAVVVSAASTAAASFDALYGEAGNVAANQQTLGQLRRAHVELLSLVASQSGSICRSDGDAGLTEALKTIADRALDAIAPRDSSIGGTTNSNVSSTPGGKPSGPVGGGLGRP